MEIREHNGFAMLHSPDHELPLAISLSAVTDSISSVLRNSEELDVNMVELFHDKNCLIISVRFPPQKALENVQSILKCSSRSQSGSLSHQIIASLNNQLPDVQLSVDVELYLCSPARECKVNRVTFNNARFYVDRYESSALFKFPSLMEQRSIGQDSRGMLSFTSMIDVQLLFLCATLIVLAPGPSQECINGCSQCDSSSLG